MRPVFASESDCVGETRQQVDLTRNDRVLVKGSIDIGLRVDKLRLETEAIYILCFLFCKI